MGQTMNEKLFPTRYIPEFKIPLDHTEMIDVRMRLATQKIKLSIYQPKNADISRTIIYIHGNGENIYLIDGYMHVYANMHNSRVVSFDWCGYGDSTGTASEFSMLRCTNAVFNFVKQKYQLSNSDVIVWGNSIGSVSSIYMGSIYPDLKCCIAQSPPASSDDVWGKSCVNCLKSYQRIKNVKCPIYIIHGTSDKIVPFKNAVKLVQNFDGIIDFELTDVFEGVKMFKTWNLRLFAIMGGEHNNLQSLFSEQLEYCVKQAMD
ncbi:Alpha/beta_hydrolase family protein [Hexamita inflata]|uniref:Alpha/beta hydrolase family protein n=1 Tax=Hexamita inflata TaxID=28002 RepID=A0AA86Q0P6_9EUKA|nr:Alpha/beta hydrolase family protein [Hexamita inflata]CAI9953317.1 Alpha/beta hydrolase family protein [Hexamita inflata]